jgi:hypothetical protein
MLSYGHSLTGCSRTVLREPTCSGNRAFHPSVERVAEERVQMRRNIEALRRARNGRDNVVEPDDAPEPTRRMCAASISRSPCDGMKN